MKTIRHKVFDDVNNVQIPDNFTINIKLNDKYKQIVDSGKSNGNLYFLLFMNRPKL